MEARDGIEPSNRGFAVPGLTTWLPRRYSYEELGVNYLRAKAAGKVIRKTLSTNSLRIAKIKRDALLAKVRVQAGAIRSSGPLMLSDAIGLTRAYYAGLESYQLKPASMRYREGLLAIMKRTLPERAISSYSAKEIKAWWNSPEITRYAPQRRNNLLGTFRKMFDLAIRSGACWSDPSEELNRVRIPARPVRVPSREDFRKLVDSIRAQQFSRSSEEAANFVEFLAFSGMRIGEAQAVEWADVGAHSIRVTGGERGTKNHEHRHVPIVEPMRSLLDRIRPKEMMGPLWSIKNPHVALSNACKREGIPHIRIHDLRHLFATTCIESGVDIPTVSRWLGHKDGGVLALKVYGHLRDEHSQREASKVRF